MPQVIATFDDEYEFLSNFYWHGFDIDGAHVPTSEHAYQARKSRNIAMQRRIRNAASPSAAKRLGRKANIPDDWHKTRVRHMYEVLRQKFDGEMGDRLLETSPALLVECNDWGDQFWGVSDGRGKNMLGSLLMHIRDEIAATQHGRML